MQGSTPVAVDSVVYTGLSLYSDYFLVDESLRNKPDLVVVECNPYYFSKAWQGRDRIQLATLVPTARWPTLLALQPEHIGLTVDELMLFRGLYARGWLDQWRWFQTETARAAKAYWVVAGHVQSAIGRDGGLRFRFQHQLASRSKRALPDHPVLAVLSEVLERFREAGVRTLVFVPPYNVALCVAFHCGERYVRERWPAGRAPLAARRVGPLVEGVAWGVLVGIAIAASGTGAEFIYFQF